MKILLLPYIAGKAWNGATLYQESLGGSETAVAYLAKSLVRKGHEVTVVTHGEPGTFDGVRYHHVNYLSLLVQSEEFDAVISSRWIEVLENPWKTKLRIFWTHDLPHQQNLKVAAQHGVLLSQFHAKFWGLPAESYTIIGNGVDNALFRPGAQRNENVLVWTSNPDRGLALAAKIFQEIRKRWPDFELHIYGRASVYGWGPEGENLYMPRPEHMENVFVHESLNKIGLAKVLCEAWAWFYPTYWPETYCIAALEAQAAGTPVLSVPYGALPETVIGGVLTWDLLNGVSQLRNKSKWQKESEAGLKFAQTRDWDNVADEWLALMNFLLVKEAQP